MDGGLRSRVLDYLQTHHSMTIASQGEEGVWAAAVFYVNDGFRLYFLSAPTTRHSRNIAWDGRIAITIQEDCADWPQIKGIQAEGLAVEIGGDDERRARELYGAKYPVVGKLAQAPAAIVKALAKVRWYRFEPERLFFIDNSAGFGRRDAIDCRS
ncbi:pyridoxamine 5'-phosphate oxidase family protein [Azoarcus sp. KH32C]|uniref:pyridoxamine 5'-phosphate oxidase family protein n=1 Tax=Azoarcus sp. KH32C TaxID=748247 RepID=UPI0002385D3C|nr:pyridoxamine 5'-phosphate oxidase family protein [Azoarcus sp. KH32C]BAL27010.1 pyridoxamine 5'-phosphate oxidase-related, FMN-binding protein [Azoarcus sp. KH32C]